MLLSRFLRGMRLIRAFSRLCAVLRKGSRVRVYSRKILRFSLIALTILAGRGSRFFGIVLVLITVFFASINV
jgi:hypothetical protein